MGGGSSNAAVTLLALSKLFELELAPTLPQLALDLGSDVPFFLNPIPSFAESRGEILEPIKLDRLDYLVINSLKDNSRKAISDVADEIGSNIKTVRRHLDRLIENNFIIFTIDWYPDKTGESLSFIQLNVNPQINPVDLRLEERLRDKFKSNFILLWEFSNLPNFKLLCVWFKSMKQLQEIEMSLLSDNTFESINLSVLVEGEIFPTWIDVYLEEKIKEIKSK